MLAKQKSAIIVVLVQDTVGAGHRAAPQIDGSRIKSLHTQVNEGGDGPHHVGQGVQSTDFMQMDLLGRLTMNVGLDLDEGVKNFHGLAPDRPVQTCLAQHGLNGTPAAMGLPGRAVDGDPDGGQAAPGDPPAPQTQAIQGEGIHVGTQMGEGITEIDQSAQEHVAARTGERIGIEIREDRQSHESANDREALVEVSRRRRKL